MTPTSLVLALAALVAGVVIGWLVASVRKGAEAARLLAERDSTTQATLRAAAEAATRASAERDSACREREKIESEVADVRRKIAEAQQARAIAETRVLEAEKSIAAHQSFVEGSKKQLEEQFAALASRALKSVGEQLLQLGKTQFDGSKGELVQSLETKRAEIDTLLAPLREMVENYRGELVKSEQTRNEVYGGLQEQIRSLLIAQESSQREAARLATALQSPTVRGSWGEVTLRRCVEMAGLSEYCDFFTQESFSGDDGKRLRPDLIVRLPNNRVIAVDSKAPTNEYKMAADATDEIQRRDLLQAHARNLRRHIEALSRKEYQSAVGESLDFTVMFLPAEHLLSAAFVIDPDLFEFAVQRKVYVASPTVLLPLLRAIQAGWKAEKTEENAKRMHDAAVELFGRFVTVMEHLSGVGEQLRKTVDSYNKVIRSIDTRLWPKGEELQRMAGSGKNLGDLVQIDEQPIESTKLRLAMQPDEPMLVP